MESNKYGNTYVINLDEYHGCISNIVYYPKLLSDKKGLIDTKIAAMNSDKVKKI